MATSYNGWAASPDPAAIGINRGWEPIPGFDFPGGIKGGDVEVVMTYLVQQLDARVEPIEMYPAGDEWGYAFRDSVNNPDGDDDEMSCHASGTAIDYNATRHPNGQGGTWTAAQRREIDQILKVELGGVVKNLTDFDEMHFEIKGTAAQVKAVADRLRNQTQEMFTVGQYEEIMKALGEVKSGLLVDISEGREEADDTPGNLPDILKEQRVNIRTAIVGINELRAKAGLPPLKIVIGYDAEGKPRYQA